MQSTQLTCFLFNDLEPWERRVFEGLIEGLSSSVKIETVWVTESQRGLLKQQQQGNIWIVSKRWHRALNFLGAKKHGNGKVFVSVLDLQDEKRPLHGLSFLSFFATLPKNIVLLVHNPSEYRFFNEIKKIPSSQLKLIELPFIPKPRSRDSVPQEKFVVGTLCQFSPESNVPFLLGVFHFVSKIDSQIQFRVMGRGLLYNHFARMVNELGLENQVSIIETVSEDSVGALDLFLFSPLRAAHFIPLLVAAAHRIPVLSIQVDGLQSWFSFVEERALVPHYEVKAMGNKILELKKEADQRKILADKFVGNVADRFSLGLVSKKFQELFFGQMKWEDSREAA